MKVLILHQHFNTPEKGGAIRSYYLAKALADASKEVVVITGYNEELAKKEWVEGIEVWYLPVPYDNSFGFWKRSLSFLSYIFKSYRVVSRLDRPDICYAISVPLTIGIAARWIKWRKKIPYIFEVGDLWPDAPIQMGFVKNLFFQKILFALERSIYRNAQSIVALSPPIKSAIERKVPDAKVHLITNMADTEFYKPSVKNTELEKKFGVQHKFVISYVGAMGVANGLDFLLRCAKECEQASLPVQFLLCGEGAMRKTWQQEATQLKLTNLSFINFQNREGVKELMNVTDAAFICYKGVPILETGSPNKFFDALAAGKLILVNFGGWIKTEIEQEQCGLSISSVQEFVRKVEPFLGDRERLREFQEASRKLAEKKYSRIQLSKAFNTLFEH